MFLKSNNLPFITKESSKCMLGILSKNICDKDDVVSWTVRGKNHVVIIDDNVSSNTISRLKDVKKANLHYLSDNSVNELSKFFKVKIQRGISVIIDVDCLDFSGKKNKQFRNYLNKYSNFEVVNHLKKPTDLKIMIKDWSDNMGEKYFRNMSGKNVYFFNNNYHLQCENVFVYDDDMLVAFGVTSPVRNGANSYVIGKALSHKYPGMAEFVDMKMYKYLFNKYGPFSINLGQGSGGLLKYKMKFPGARQQIHYHGSFE